MQKKQQDDQISKSFLWLLKVSGDPKITEQTIQFVSEIHIVQRRLCHSFNFRGL